MRIFDERLKQSRKSVLQKTFRLHVYLRKISVYHISTFMTNTWTMVKIFFSTASSQKTIIRPQQPIAKKTRILELNLAVNVHKKLKFPTLSISSEMRHEFDPTKHSQKWVNAYLAFQWLAVHNRCIESILVSSQIGLVPICWPRKDGRLGEPGAMERSLVYCRAPLVTALRAFLLKIHMW